MVPHLSTSGLCSTNNCVLKLHGFGGHSIMHTLKCGNKIDTSQEAPCKQSLWPLEMCSRLFLSVSRNLFQLLLNSSWSGWDRGVHPLHSLPPPLPLPIPSVCRPYLSLHCTPSLYNMLFRIWHRPRRAAREWDMLSCFYNNSLRTPSN